MTKWVLTIATFSMMFVLSLNSLSYAFHENLGIDDNKASELYRTNPNDPAIVQWKSALQSAINDVNKCLDIESAISCVDFIQTIKSNCVSHPNTLLACNDSRFSEYYIILKQAQEAQKKAIEEMKRTRPIQIQAHGNDILEKCFLNSLNASSKFEVAGLACDLEMRSLQSECQLANNTYNYCKDERFVGYLTQYNLLNSTSSP